MSAHFYAKLHGKITEPPTVGEFIKSRLKKKGWSVAQGAKRAGIDPDYLHELLDDKKPIRAPKRKQAIEIATSVRLSRAFGLQKDRIALVQARREVFEIVQAQPSLLVRVRRPSLENE
jgi:plasmid maintenance system antidote protein VapI